MIKNNDQLKPCFAQAFQFFIPGVHEQNEEKERSSLG